MHKEVDVLVVGAGLGGLSAALFLSHFGARVMLVEQHEQTSIYPKAAGQNPRTMELLRIGGVANEVKEAADIRGSQGDFTIKVVESVPGRVLHTFAESFEELVAATEECTPMPWALTAQDKLEPILLTQAVANGAGLRFGTELTSFIERPDQVFARLRTRADDIERTVSARYLVAADGPRSAIREQLGITRHGHGSLAHFVGLLFEANLDAVLPPGSTGWYYLQHPQFTGTFGPTDHPDRHTFYVRYDPERGESPADFTPERCVELIQLAVDSPRLKPQVLDVQTWEMAAHIADDWRVGRILLIGDAAKVTPPTGGMGGNAAIGDGFDAAWKLTSVLQGEAGDGLLDSYALERRQAAELIVDEAMAIYAERMAPEFIGQVPKSRGTAEVIMGSRCRSGAVLIEDDDPTLVEDPLSPSGRPGFRAPHIWVDVNGARTSTTELYGDGWVLLAGPDGTEWRAAARRAARALKVHLDAYVFCQDLADTDGELLRNHGIGRTGASLIRPDGVIAWRRHEASEAPYKDLHAVLCQVLCR